MIRRFAQATKHFETNAGAQTWAGSVVCANRRLTDAARLYEARLFEAHLFEAHGTKAPKVPLETKTPEVPLEIDETA